MNHQTSPQNFDCVIVGCGPAGLGAALYTARDRYKTIVLEKFYPGGQINNTDRIENYPGFDKISGPELIMKMADQARAFGAEIVTSSEVTSLKRLDDGTIQIGCDGKIYTSRVVILSPGSDYRKLSVPGEDEFRSAGSGVSYCGTCDAPFFKGKKVVAVGGGNSAVEETLHLAKFCSEVVLVHRRNEFRATRVLTEELMEKVNGPGSNIRLVMESTVTAIEGQEKVQKARVKNIRTGLEDYIPCDGVFIFIGMVPNTGFLRGFVDLTDAGFIICDTAYLRTTVPGVFGAGDCRVGAAMQLVTAVADGVNAAIWMKQYLREPSWWSQAFSDRLAPGGW